MADERLEACAVALAEKYAPSDAAAEEIAAILAQHGAFATPAVETSQPYGWAGEFRRRGGEEPGEWQREAGRLFHTEQAAREWLQQGDDDWESRVVPLYRATPTVVSPGSEVDHG